MENAFENMCERMKNKVELLYELDDLYKAQESVRDYNKSIEITKKIEEVKKELDRLDFKQKMKGMLKCTKDN